jgi:hypothetical protein
MGRKSKNEIPRGKLLADFYAGIYRRMDERLRNAGIDTSNPIIRNAIAEGIRYTLTSVMHFRRSEYFSAVDTRIEFLYRDEGVEGFTLDRLLQINTRKNDLI